MDFLRFEKFSFWLVFVLTDWHDKDAKKEGKALECPTSTLTAAAFACTNCCTHSSLPMGTPVTRNPVVEMSASIPDRHAN